MTEFTQADIDSAIKEALTKAREEFEVETDGLKTKTRKLIDKLRALEGVTPEGVAAIEARAEKVELDLAEANKQLKVVTADRDRATKALESEQGAARSYALEAEIADAIAKGNVVPALVPAFKAMVIAQAKADLVDGKYAVQIGDKAARDHIAAYLDSDEGKAFRAAPINGGGGAHGGSATGGAGKVVSSADFGSMPAKARAAFMDAGGTIADAA